VVDQKDMLGMPEGDEALELLQAGADDVPEDRWAPTLARLVEVLVARFKRNGMRETEAGRLANDTVLEIAHYFGGRTLYLPRGDRLTIALRDAEIYRRARRGNVQQLAEEFELTDIQVWRIVRQQRRLHIAKIQPGLFTEKGES
jgi:Mor family transcriptional regulator